MRTVVLGERPEELEALIATRRATGADLYDEVWEGAYHMAPAPGHPHSLLDGTLARALGPLAARAGLLEGGAFNLGGPDDFRVPDRGVFRAPTSEVWLPTAALVVEIVSPHDESWKKFDFYAAHGVDEVLIVDPHHRLVSWFALDVGAYSPTAHSAVLDVDVADIVSSLDWPPTDDSPADDAD